MEAPVPELGRWLQGVDRASNPYTKFAVVDVRELHSPDEQTQRYLSAQLLAARLDPGFLEAASAELHWEDVERLVEAMLPHGMTVRRGLLGEVVSAVSVRDLFGYMIPVAKFRFAASSEVSPPATDVLAMRVRNGNIEEVCYVESKLRTGRRRSVAIEGARQLSKDQAVAIPQILTFALARLAAEGSELFGPLARYSTNRAEHPASETSRLFVLNERSAWTEDALADLEDEDIELAPLTVHVILIDHLGDLSDRLFAGISVGELSDDD